MKRIAIIPGRRTGTGFELPGYEAAKAAERLPVARAEMDEMKKGNHPTDLRRGLAHTQGDAINAILAAAGYNFSLLLRWLKQFLWLLIAAFLNRPKQLAA
nr:hypothetical protein [Mesorhizobium ventifaucium]